MDKNSVIGEVIEKGQQAVGNKVTNTAANTAGSISDTVSEQLGFNKPKTQQNQNNLNQAQSVSDSQAVQTNSAGGADVTEATKEIVEDFYAPTDNNSNNPSASAPHQNMAVTDTQQKLAKVRQELLEQHKTEYYNPLFAYENKKPEPTKAQVAEEEEYKKMQDLALEQQKRNEDIALTRAKTSVETRASAG